MPDEPAVARVTRDPSGNSPTSESRNAPTLEPFVTGDLGNGYQWQTSLACILGNGLFACVGGHDLQPSIITDI